MYSYYIVLYSIVVSLQYSVWLSDIHSNIVVGQLKSSVVWWGRASRGLTVIWTPSLIEEVTNSN